MRIRLLGGRPITLSAGEPGYLFPARGMPGTRGVSIQVGTDPPGYLGRASVLSTAAAGGFRVGGNEQRIRYA